MGGLETQTGESFPPGQAGSVVGLQQGYFDPIYTYDLNGNRTSMIDPTGQTTYTYNALNRLTSITNNQGLTTSFTYDALGRRTSMTHDNGVETTYELRRCLSAFEPGSPAQPNDDKLLQLCLR